MSKSPSMLAHRDFVLANSASRASQDLTRSSSLQKTPEINDFRLTYTTQYPKSQTKRQRTAANLGGTLPRQPERFERLRRVVAKAAQCFAAFVGFERQDLACAVAVPAGRTDIVPETQPGEASAVTRSGAFTGGTPGARHRPPTPQLGASPLPRCGERGLAGCIALGIPPAPPRIAWPPNA